MTPLTSKLGKFEKSFAELTKTVEFLSTKYDQLLKQLQGSNKKITDLTVEVSSAKVNINGIQANLAKARQEIDDLAQYLRRDCVEITGVKPDETTSSEEIVVQVAAEMGMEIEESDISTAHTLPTFNQNSDGKLIAKFISRNIRKEFYRKRNLVAGKKLSQLSHHLSLEGNNKFFISESLTPLRKKLFGTVNKLR